MGGRPLRDLALPILHLEVPKPLGEALASDAWSQNQKVMLKSGAEIRMRLRSPEAGTSDLKCQPKSVR